MNVAAIKLVAIYGVMYARHCEYTLRTAAIESHD